MEKNTQPINQPTTKNEENKAVLNAVSQELLQTVLDSETFSAKDFITLPIYIDRKSFEAKKSKKLCYKYCVYGKESGRDVTVNFLPAMKEGQNDLGAYLYLDIMFGEDNRAQLCLLPYERENAEGEIVKGYSYYAVNLDTGKGIQKWYKVRPASMSDASFLTGLVKQVVA